MHLNVKVLFDYVVVTTDKPQEHTVGWLIREAVVRYKRAIEPQSLDENEQAKNVLRIGADVEDLPNQLGTVVAVRRKRDQALLLMADVLGDVLLHGEYVDVDFDRKKPTQGAKYVGIPSEEEADFNRDLSGKTYLELDGDSLTPEDLIQLGKGDYRIKLSEMATKKVLAAREIVDNIVKKNQVTYGINTGFGKFASTVIDKNKLKELQVSLVRSHAAGVGKPIGLRATRMLFALRINVLAKGHSGITLETLLKMVDIYNASCLPWIPEQGTVGASGDLAPLSHLALGLIGEGRMWSPLTGWTSAKNVLSAYGLSALELEAKEGLCLINGTQLITSIGVEACVRAGRVAQAADVISALTVDVCKGTTTAFDPDVGRVRPHKGQIQVARRLQALLHNRQYHSELAESHRYCSKVQDPYSLRCCPQVHGIVNETIDFVRQILCTEMNSATDNPLVFSERGVILSAGNFHGEYPAKALDYLAIAVHELANISERRIERLVNPAYSELPAFLTKRGGLNSGFMIAQVTAAALVSENKVLCHPASVDSLPTSAGQEDHVSMGGFAARKCLQVVKNVEHVLAIELLAAAQALDFLRPLKTTAPLEAVHRLVRGVSSTWEEDRFMSPEIEAVTPLILSGKLWDTVLPYLDKYDQLDETTE